MIETLSKSKVKCPKCKSEFEIDTLPFDLDKELTCPECDTIFTMRSNFIISNKKLIGKLDDIIKTRMNENKKGNIKLSQEELKSIKKSRDKLKKFDC